MGSDICKVTGKSLAITSMAMIGEIGRVKDLTVDEEDWVLRYLLVDTGDTLLGEKVLVSPQWVKRVGWTDYKVQVNLSRTKIKRHQDPNQILTPATKPGIIPNDTHRLGAVSCASILVDTIPSLGYRNGRRAIEQKITQLEFVSAICGEEIDMGTNSSVGSFLGFLDWRLAAAATALLLAPQSGEETRTQLREKGIELKEKAETTYADLQEKVETSVADLRERVDELSDKVDRVIVQGREVFSREPIDLGEETAPDEEPVAEKVVTEV